MECLPTSTTASMVGSTQQAPIATTASVVGFTQQVPIATATSSGSSAHQAPMTTVASVAGSTQQAPIATGNSSASTTHQALIATAAPVAGSTHQALIAKCEYQIKLVTLLNEATDYLRSVLHDPARGNMPTNKNKLCQKLLLFKKKLNHLKKDQLEIVFPPNNETNSELFDITILCDVLINCCPGIQAPIGGWKKTPRPNDFSDGAEILRIRMARNKVMHGTALTEPQYNQLWTTIEGILRNLGYDITKIKDLKSGCLSDLELFKIKIMNAQIEIQQFNDNKNQGDIKTNKDNIQQNEDDIKTNQGDIKTNKDNIQQNEDDIKTNKGDINQIKNEVETVKQHISMSSQLEKTAAEQPSFMLLKNNRGDFVIKFEDGSSKWSIQCVKISSSENFPNQSGQLHVDNDYIVEEKQGRLILIIYNHIAEYINSLSITLVDSESKTQLMSIKVPVTNVPACNIWMHKNTGENMVVKVHDKSIQSVHKINVTREGEDTMLELQETDYHEERKDNRLVLTIYKEAIQCIAKLAIALLDMEGKQQLFEIDNVNIACAHKYTYKESNFSLHTHNSDKVAAHIKSIISTPFSETNIQLFCCGEVQENSRSEYLKFSRNYVNENCTSNNDFLKEAVQFPPPMLNEEVSKLAFRLKSILSKIRHVFVIFTHYNTMDNLRLLNLNTFCDRVPDFKHRLLLLHPSQNTFVNIRYTETTSATIIQEEFQNGEVDIKHLFAINRQFILDSTSRFINVVAAPNFPKLENIDVCASCQLLDQSILLDDAKVRTFFLNLELTRRYPDKKIKEQYMNILGQAMCFMASRETMNTVPTIKDDIHGKICTVLLSSEQSNILFNESKKKIIVGPLGSGKSVLALSHLKHLCQCCEGKCIIYYVLWSDKTILLNAVEEFVSTFQCNKNITLKVKNAIELAKELNLSKLPTLSQLLLLLLKKHGGMSFHFISDEVDGAMFDKQEALSLKQILEREEALQNSMIVLFLQSLEKHRRLVSSGKSKSHDNYKYEEAGMRVFYLNKAMRTTKQNFNFLVQFEKKISGMESVIKHPVQNKNHETSSAKSETTSSTVQENLSQRRVQKIKNSQVKPGEKSKKIFEEPVDIEEIAAVSNYPGASDHMKTLTKVKCNSAQEVGHNIEGPKPILIHLNYENETEEKSIVMLALSLEDYLDRVNIKRLFFHNTVEQMITFRRVLDLIGEDYFVYNKQTEWNIIDRSNVVTNLPKNKGYDLITNLEGSRGTEFCETVCCIDVNDTMLRHKTLEGMSRVTERLIIVCACNIQSATTNSSTGHIIKDLLPEYLNEVSVECAKNSNKDLHYIEMQVSDKKSIGFVNTTSRRYKDLMERIKKIKYKKDGSDVYDFARVIRKKFQPPTINASCNFTNDNTCTINWNDEGYRYVIEMENDRSQWQNVEQIISFGECVINNLVVGNKYKFRVLASNDFGQAQSEISYRHVNKLPSGLSDISVTFEDIVEIIKSNDINNLKQLLSIHPNIVHMRDEHEYTPLLWTVRYTNNTSMVEILILHGSDVWAEDILKYNSYHLAAFNDRHTILDILCRHDVTNINRVDVNNCTPLHWAAMYGRISCVDVLLRHENIDVTIEDKYGQTAYDRAGWMENEQNREIIRRKIKEYEARKK